MTPNPVAQKHGDTIRFHRDLYTVLRKLGYSYPEMEAMSVRAALLICYGSVEAVNADLGEGVYTSVQQRHRGHSSWRKQWKRAIAEHEDEYFAQCAALEHLRESARRCHQLGVNDQDIHVACYTALTTTARVVTFAPMQQLPQAQ